MFCCKKLLMLGVIGGVAFLAVRGTKFGSYIRSEAASVSEWADDQIPVERKIAQMRRQVGDLDKDIERIKGDLAKEIVAVREMNQKTTELRATLDGEQKAIVAKSELIKDATERVKFGHVSLTVPDAKERLKGEVNLHMKRKQQLSSMEKHLEHREKIKESLQKQLDALVQKKVEMKTEIDAVEADYKSLEYQRIESKYTTDDSRLGDIKKSLQELKSKIDVEKTRIELNPKVEEVEVPVSGASAQTIDEILAPLNGAKVTK